MLLQTSRHPSQVWCGSPSGGASGHSCGVLIELSLPPCVAASNGRELWATFTYCCPRSEGLWTGRMLLSPLSWMQLREQGRQRGEGGIALKKRLPLTSLMRSAMLFSTVLGCHARAEP